MTDSAAGPLAGRRVLVVEDNFLIALNLGECLGEGGAEVIGPCASAAEALAAIAAGGIDCAVVDLNLGEGPDFTTAAALREAGIPFALATGYDGGSVPEEFATVPMLQKPVSGGALVAALLRLAPA